MCRGPASRSSFHFRVMHSRACLLGNSVTSFAHVSHRLSVLTCRASIYIHICRYMYMYISVYNISLNTINFASIGKMFNN